MDIAEYSIRNRTVSWMILLILAMIEERRAKTRRARLEAELSAREAA